MMDIAEEITTRQSIETDHRLDREITRMFEQLTTITTEPPRRGHRHLDRTARIAKLIEEIKHTIELRVRNANELGLVDHLYFRDALGEGTNFFHYLEDGAPISELHLSEDAANLLWEADIETVGELSRRTRSWLSEIAYKDQTSVAEIERALALCRRKLAE